MIVAAIALLKASISKIVYRLGLKIVNRSTVVKVFFNSTKASRAFVIIANAVSDFFIRSISSTAIRE